MKIFEIIPQLSQGGAERFVVDLANNLAETNDVTLVVLHTVDKDSFIYSELSSKVVVVALNKKKGIDLSIIYKINSLIRKEKPDIVHSHLRAILYLFVACITLRFTKYIHTVHSDADRETGGWIGFQIRKLLFKRNVLPVTISRMSQTSFENLYKYKNVLIYNGAVPYIQSEEYSCAKELMERFRLTSNTRLILNVARVNRLKNQLALVKAVANLNEAGNDIQLIIIGDHQDPEIIDTINQYNYPFIHLLGVKSNPRDFMCLADAFCLSSVYEGMPISLLECFSVGSIPICTPVGGIVDVVEDGKNGILTEGIEVFEIESALNRFLNMTTDQISKMKASSAETYLRYSMSACAEQYEKLMQKHCHAK